MSGWDMLRECEAREADSVTVKLASSSAGPIEIDWAALKSRTIEPIPPEAQPPRFVWNVEATDANGLKWTESVHESEYGANDSAEQLRTRPIVAGGHVRVKRYRVWG